MTTTVGFNPLYFITLSPVTVSNDVFVRIIDGGGSDVSYNVKTDAYGNMYVCGHYSGGVSIKNSKNVALNSLPSLSGQSSFVSKFKSDGTYLYSIVVDSSGTDSIRSISCDNVGNLYVAGFYNGSSCTIYNVNTSNVATAVGTLRTSSGNAVFVSKFDSSGLYQYSRLLDCADGTANDVGYSVACDTSGSMYISGSYNGTPILYAVTSSNVSSTITTLQSSSGDCAFLCKFNSTGTFQYARTIDSLGSDIGYAVSCDQGSNVYIAGQYTGTPIIYDQNGNSVATLRTSTGTSSFISKFSSNGTYQYSRVLDSGGTDIAYSVACDPSSNVYFAGSYNGTPTLYSIDSSNVSTTITTLQASSGDAAFVCKFNADGSYQFSNVIDSGGGDAAWSVSCDSSSNFYLCGYYTGTPSGITLPPSSGTAAFVSKFDTTGTNLLSRVLDSGGTDVGFSSTTDSNGNIYFSGYYNGTPVLKSTDGTVLSRLPGSSGDAAFVCKLNSGGGVAEGLREFYVTIDGSGTEHVYSCAERGGNYLYISGQYSNTATVRNSFGDTLCTLPAPVSNSNAAFLVSVTTLGVFKWARIVDATTSSSEIAWGSSGGECVYIAGQYNGTAVIKDQNGTTVQTLSTAASSTAAFLYAFDVITGDFLFGRVLDSGGNEIGYSVCGIPGDIYWAGVYFNAGVIKNAVDGATILTLPNVGTISAGFVIKFSSSGDFIFARIFDSGSTVTVKSVWADGGNNFAVGGTIGGTCIIKDEGGNNLFTLPSIAGNAAFVSRFDSGGSHTFTRYVAGTGNGVYHGNGIVILGGQYSGSGVVIRNESGGVVSNLPATTSGTAFMSVFYDWGDYKFTRVVDSAGTDTCLGVSAGYGSEPVMMGQYNGTPNVKTESNVTLYTLPATSGTTSTGFLCVFDGDGAFLRARLVDGNNSNDFIYNMLDLGDYCFVAGACTGTPTLKREDNTTITTFPGATGIGGFAIYFNYGTMNLNT